MTPYVLERRQILPVDMETAWRFFSDPGNLPLITPPDMEFRITSTPGSTTYAGQIITYTVKPLFGIAVSWTSEITQVQEPNFFVDEQRFGPYRFWHHQHRLTQVAGGVEVHDLIHYLLPHEQLTGLINRLFVAPRLRRIFDYRRDTLQKLFPG